MGEDKTPDDGDTPRPTHGSEPAAPDGATEDSMTLDAFEAAVSAAISDQLGDPTAGAEATKGRIEMPKGADEMVANVLSALTGQSAKAALEQVREKLRNPDAPDRSADPFAAFGERGADEDDDNVINLQAARDARQKRPSGGPPSEMSLKIGDVLKQTFANFMKGYAKDHATPNGQITLDAQFLKENGPQLLGNLFQGLAGALIPGDPNAPKTPTQLRAMGPVDLPPLDVEEALEGTEFATSEADPDAETQLKAVPDADAAADAAADAVADAETDAVADAETDAVADAETDAVADAETDAETDAVADAEAPAQDITVKFDVGSLLASLFKPRTPKS